MCRNTCSNNSPQAENARSFAEPARRCAGRTEKWTSRMEAKAGNSGCTGRGGTDLMASLALRTDLNAATCTTHRQKLVRNASLRQQREATREMLPIGLTGNSPSDRAHVRRSAEDSPTRPIQIRLQWHSNRVQG